MPFGAVWDIWFYNNGTLTTSVQVSGANNYVGGTVNGGNVQWRVQYCGTYGASVYAFSNPYTRIRLSKYGFGSVPNAVYSVQFFRM